MTPVSDLLYCFVESIRKRQLDDSQPFLAPLA
jgi:hypothetical protein